MHIYLNKLFFSCWIIWEMSNDGWANLHCLPLCLERGQLEISNAFKEVRSGIRGMEVKLGHSIICKWEREGANDGSKRWLSSSSSSELGALEDVVSFHPSYLWLYIHLFNSARPTLLPHENRGSISREIRGPSPRGICVNLTQLLTSKCLRLTNFLKAPPVIL